MPTNKKARGTGFVQVDQLKKLLAQDEEDDDDEHNVKFDVEEIDGEPKQRKFRGTGFVAVDQLKKLLAEAGEEDEDEEYRRRLLAEFKYFDAKGAGTVCRLRLEAILL